MHWLGVAAVLPAALVSELALPPTPDDVLLPMLPEVLPEVLLEGALEGLVEVLPDAPDALVPLALDCAHDAPDTATNAVATAAAIALTITIESPWSVEKDCPPHIARAVPAGSSFRSTAHA